MNKMMTIGMKLVALAFVSGLWTGSEAGASALAPVPPTVRAAQAELAAPTSPATAATDPKIEAFAVRMQVPLPLLKAGIEGLEQIYRRDYAAADATFATLSTQYPSSGVGPFGMVMSTQSRMGENLDFSQDKRYEVAFTEAEKRLSAAIDRGESEAWNRFLRGCARGVNSLYLYRKDKILSALYDGITAINDIETARKLDPDFKDPYIGLGVYDYWRSAATLRYKQLPFFPDKRDAGLRQMAIARDEGIITPTLARLALAYSYLDRTQYRQGLNDAEALVQRYPRSVISLQVAGHLYARTRQIPKALSAYERVLSIDPQNFQACYYLGMLYLHRISEPIKAAGYLERFVNGQPDSAYLASGRTRLGDAYWLQGKEVQAKEQWGLALKANPDYRLAKARSEGNYPVARKKRVYPTGSGNPNNPRLQEFRAKQLRQSGVAIPATAVSPASANPASTGSTSPAAPSSTPKAQ